MKSWLLVAHGSRQAESSTEIASLTRSLAVKASAEFAVVEHAFLDLADTLIPDGIERCIAKGATELLNY